MRTATVSVTTATPAERFFNALNTMEDNIFLDANVIYDAGTKAMKGSSFKYSTHLFEMNHLLYTAMIQKNLREGTYTPEAGSKFLIRERGKPRYITSNTMADKTINHIISDEILTPSLSKYLIYDNGASQKGKGVSFHRKRFEAHLHKYFMEHGNNEGYILLGDFSGYYANIPHDKCYGVLEQFLTRSLDNPEELKYTLWLLAEMFKTFRVDVSRFSDEEIQAFRTGKVDQMLNMNADPVTLTGEKFLDKGVDIGNQNSQSIGLIYPYRLDNFAKIVKSIKGYGRYTDDFYAIAGDKETLRELLDGLRVIAKEFGLIINERKTRIVKLSGFYRHLQNGYSLTETGRVICKINPKSVTRERRKLKAYKRLLDAGKITYGEIENIFKSWIGGNFKRMSRQQIYNMTELYKNLFGRIPEWRKGHSRLRWLMEHKSADSD
ncbi:MAG: hypothetical protein IJP48_07010 [Synergistaceae bacterium]|nr:hypothetical protein [Synergistaceae bacterium]